MMHDTRYDLAREGMFIENSCAHDAVVLYKAAMASAIS